MPTLPADRLTPKQLADLVNATEPGTITPAQVRYQLETAKHRLGTGGRIHLLMYIAWLRRLLAEGQKLKHKDERSQAEVMRDRRAAGRDIGEIPAVKDPKRRKACRADLARFLRTYLPESFPLDFSADHLHVIGKIQAAALGGGLFAEAVFRGFGKTTILRGAAIWAMLYGHRKFVVVIAADKKAGTSIIDDVKAELEDNDLLLEDFPEVCVPARALEGIAHRCPGQLSQGVPTKIEWCADAVALPSLPGSASAGVVLKAYGLTGRLRGMHHKRRDGSTVRPDFVLLDDPQTDASAKSQSQCDTREKLITGAVLGLAGHTGKLCGLIACTIIRKGDMADRILDHKAHPEWQGTILPMVRKWAERHKDLWLGRYAELRRADLPESLGGRAEAVRQAAAFYLDNRADMDRGAEVSWAQCFEPDEHSAIQHAYNLLIDRGEKVFMAEYQNAPIDEYEGEEPPLEPRDVLAKACGLERRVAPHGCTTLVAYIDCRKPQLHYVVAAFGEGFRGHVLDYGQRNYMRSRRGGLEAALTSALSLLTLEIAGRAYRAEQGGELRVALCLVDSGWLTKTIYAFCRQSILASILVPSKGQGGEIELRPPAHVPRRDWGDGWYHALTLKRDARLLVYNTDHWKSLAAERIRTPLGGRGTLSICGRGEAEHYAFAQHCTSERPEPKKKKTGEVFDKWAALPGRPNHWWDCLVGCHVGAARLGIALDAIGGQASAPRAGKAIRLSELQNARRA